jgi:hypothetical protein
MHDNLTSNGHKKQVPEPKEIDSEEPIMTETSAALLIQNKFRKKMQIKEMEN